MFGKNKLQVQVEQLPESIDMSQVELVEIKDAKVISRIKSAVPELGVIAVNAGAVAQGIQLASEGVYKAILSAGAKLVNSRSTGCQVQIDFYKHYKFFITCILIPVYST